MDDCDPDRADCGQRERRLLTDNGLPTNANEGKRVGKKHERREKVRERAHLGLERALRAGEIPRKRGLPRGRNGWRVHRQLQMTQDFLDHASLHNRRDDPQSALLTYRAAFHVNGEHPFEQPRPVPLER